MGIVLKDFRWGNTKYILCSGRRDRTRNDIVIGAKIIISADEITKIYNTKGIPCGNDHRLIHNKAYGKHKIPIVYNKSDGILEISSKNVFGQTLFLVRKLDFGNILLTPIE